MGAYDGAEICELIGLFMLSQLKQFDSLIGGLYRDDGLIVTHLSPRETEIIKKTICEIFRKNYLSISIQANITTVDFLDVTLNLKDNTISPFRKPNDTPSYLNSSSNHPPSILKNIPIAVNKRLSELSSNKEIFDAAAPPYQEALKQSGFNFKLDYSPPPPKNSKRNRSRKILWFNPPYAANVSSNIGANFLKILDKVFTTDHPLHKIVNKNCIKVSYRCTPNLGAIISSHNMKLLNEDKVPQLNDKECNCRLKPGTECPLDGKCLTRNILWNKIYIKTMLKKHMWV